MNTQRYITELETVPIAKPSKKEGVRDSCGCYKNSLSADKNKGKHKGRVLYLELPPCRETFLKDNIMLTVHSFVISILMVNEKHFSFKRLKVIRAKFFVLI